MSDTRARNFGCECHSRRRRRSLLAHRTGNCGRLHIPGDATLRAPAAIHAPVMTHSTPLDFLMTQLVLVRETLTPGERRALFRSAERGQIVRLRPGVYIRADAWRGLSPEDRFLARIAAAVASEPGPIILSGLSAAALWRLPLIGSPPRRPEVISQGANGGRSAGSLIRHGVGIPESVVDFGSFAITSLARTLVDVARTESFETAVAMTDFSLRAPSPKDRGRLTERVTKDQLAEELESLAPTTGDARARSVSDFADGRSGSAGESLSRVAIHRLGFPAPDLQVPFVDAKGTMEVDFWWEDVRGIGEFDGEGKYLRDEYTHGRTTAQVVIDEKNRENRLRAQNTSVARWDWREARSLPALGEKLLSLGLRPLRRHFRGR
jgi:hypothetical protein